MLGFTAPPRPMAIETGGDVALPENLLPPVLSGSFFVGQMLTCPTGTWSGSPTAFEYKWQNEEADNGDTDNQYTSVSGDDGSRLRCLVRAQNAAGWSGWVASNSVIALLLRQWLDAADISTISHAAGSVSAFNDKTGNGWNFTQNTAASQPKTGVETVNGRNAILYDGVDDTMIMASFAAFGPTVLTNNTTQFHVAVPKALPTTKNIYWLFGGGGTRFGFEFAAGIGIRVFSGNNAFANIAMGGSPPLDVAYIVTGRRTGNLLEGFVNGGLQTGTVTNSNGGTANSVNIGNTAHCLHCESIVAGRAWSAAELNQVGQYLEGKWGITWTNVS